MTYQDYFRNSDFEDIWVVLNGFYMEHENLKPLYSSLVETIKTLPILPEHSETTIKMCLDSENEIMVIGAPDPQEWLIGREVETNFSPWKDELTESIKSFSNSKTFDMPSGPEKRQLARNSGTATLAVHLLYWSTLYAIKTQSQHEHEFSDWLFSLENGKVDYKMEEEYVSESFRRKQRNYPNIDGKYINLRTAEKYTREKDNEEADLHHLYLTKLYCDKAFHILWKWLDHNMKKWWD